MNEEEEEAPLEDSRVRGNRLARERHAAWSEEQCAMYASWRVAQRATRSNAQIVADANWRAIQKVARNNGQIVTDANRWAAQRAMRSDA
jgi:hypothetical protein